MFGFGFGGDFREGGFGADAFAFGGGVLGVSGFGEGGFLFVLVEFGNVGGGQGGFAEGAYALQLVF